MSECKKPVLIRLLYGRLINPLKIVDVYPPNDCDGALLDEGERFSIYMESGDVITYEFDTKEEAQTAYNELISKFEII